MGRPSFPYDGRIRRRGDRSRRLLPPHGNRGGRGRVAAGRWFPHPAFPAFQPFRPSGLPAFRLAILLGPDVWRYRRP